MGTTVTPPGAAAVPSGSGGGGDSFWTSKLPTFIRLGGVILGALLGGRGRKDGVLAAAVTGALLIGAAVHVGLGLVRQGALSDKGWDPSKMNLSDLAPAWTDFVPPDIAKNVGERFADVVAKARDVFNEGHAYILDIDTVQHFKRDFGSRDGAPRTRGVATSDLLAVGRLEGFEGATFDDPSIGQIEKHVGQNDTHAIHVKWTGGEEGKTYPATIKIKEGEETVELRVNLTRSRIGPFGGAVELELAERYVRRHTEAAISSLKDDGESLPESAHLEKMRLARSDVARALTTAAEMLDPNHPRRQDLKAEAKELERGVFAVSDLGASLTKLQQIAIRSSSPRSLNLLGESAGDAERKILEHILTIPQLNPQDLKQPIAPLAPEAALEALQTVGYRVQRGHPMATLAEHLAATVKGSTPETAAAALTDLRTVAMQRYGFLQDRPTTTTA